MNIYQHYLFLASILSAKLVQKGGNSIVAECKNNPLLQSNECRVTSGGTTKFHNIVHFITPNVNVLAQNLLNVLNLINDKLQKNSVAIPTIGAGMILHNLSLAGHF